jgi:transketolase
VSERLAAVCARELVEMARADPRIWLLDGDLADSYGAMAFAQALPDRFIMAGIAEQNMVSMAAGMAACGARPWVFSFAAFLAYRAADQIRVSVAQTGLGVTLVGSHAGGCGGRNGKTHQSTGDLAVLGSMAGIQVWTPCDPPDVQHAMAAILSTSHPGYIRAPRDPCPALPGAPGPLRWLTPPCGHILLCNGLSAHWALGVCAVARELGLQLGVLHLGRFSPPPAALQEEIGNARRWFVIEDHVRLGGVADQAANIVGRHPDAWFGWPADWAGGSGSATQLRESCHLGDTEVAAAIVSKWGSP